MTQRLHEKQGMLAHPAQTGFFRQSFFQHWCGVGKRAVTMPRQRFINLRG